MPTLTFYTNPNSRGMIVSWLLAELGLDDGQDYTTKLIELTAGEQKSPDYMAINPMGKVPSLKDGDTIITETAAICCYLADKFFERGLAPALDDPMRGVYYRWLFFTAGPVETAVLCKSMDWEVPSEKRGYSRFGCFDDTYNLLRFAATSANPYLCGDQFTAADVYLGAQIYYGISFGTLAEHQDFDDYLSQLKQRQAFKNVFNQ